MTRRPTLLRRLRRFGRSERGSSTVEFVILLPLFLGFFLSTFELGMLLTRQVMLDRGLDMTVRQVRLGAFAEDADGDGDVDGADRVAMHRALKTMICDRASIIPDCMDQLKLEMLPVDPRAWGTLPADADCVDRAADAQPLRTFTPGQMNELVILRACALFDPFFPTTGLGFHLHRESGDAYALLSSSAFVIEPN